MGYKLNFLKTIIPYLAVCLMYVQLANANVIHTEGISSRHKRSAYEDGCTYTFQVPRTDARTCPPGSSEDNTVEKIEEMQNTLSSQHVALTEKIDNLSEILQSLRPNKSETDDGDKKPSGKLVLRTHYTRWGSSSCPDSATLLYSGYAGKSHYTNGGGSNYLCLPSEPEFHNNSQAGYQSKSYIYGVEYEKHGSPLVPSEKQDTDVPCTVCHVTGRGEQIMIPAKKTCPTGWTPEYDGYLMAQHSSHKPSDYVCVDKEMEPLVGGSTNSNGGLLYMVEAVCGSLKCPPYVDGYEILCTVCTL